MNTPGRHKSTLEYDKRECMTVGARGNLFSPGTRSGSTARAEKGVSVPSSAASGRGQARYLTDCLMWSIGFGCLTGDVRWFCIVTD